MAPCQRVPLAEDVAWTLSAHLVAYNHWSAPLLKDPSPLLASTTNAYVVHRYTCRQDISTHKTFFNLMKLAKWQT